MARMMIKNEKGMSLKNAQKKIQRNDLCPCKSGAKFKDCCLNIKSGKHARKRNKFI
jgi:uncharacterized protein YecA (UPF0149 family)